VLCLLVLVVLDQKWDHLPGALSNFQTCVVCKAVGLSSVFLTRCNIFRSPSSSPLFVLSLFSCDGYIFNNIFLALIEKNCFYMLNFFFIFFSQFLSYCSVRGL